MKNLSIAIWGENGSGKSTFAAALARALTEYFTAILLASADTACPAFALWGADDAKKVSLGALLGSPTISAGFLQQNVTPAPENDCIGLLGYLAGENIEQYNPIGSEAAEAFFSAAKEFSQITIADCGLPQSDPFSYEAVRRADIIFSLIEPNRKGMAFYAAMEPVFSALTEQKHYLVCAKERSDSPVCDAAGKLGLQFDFSFPYSEEAIKKFYDCKLFERYTGITGHELHRITALLKEAS